MAGAFDMDDEQKAKAWMSFHVTFGGRSIEGITSVKFVKHYSLKELYQKLDVALSTEDYLKCAEIQKKIDSYKIEI